MKILIRLLLRQSDFLPETTILDGPEYKNDINFISKYKEKFYKLHAVEGQQINDKFAYLRGFYEIKGRELTALLCLSSCMAPRL